MPVQHPLVASSLAQPLTSTGDRLRECGIGTVAAFFPGFHESVDNNEFWGKGWTEWDHIVNLTMDTSTGLTMRHPPVYYDLNDGNGDEMRRQAAQAREAGLSAFMIYHYWFALGRTSLTQPLDVALFGRDGSATQRLGLPFYLSWANEEWSRRWVNAEKSASANSTQMLMPQGYGTPEEWDAHFDYLARYFEHPDYLHIDGKPALAIYRTSALYATGAQDFTPPPACSHSPAAAASAAGCDGAPFGCAGAEVYLSWYPDLVRGGLDAAGAYAYQAATGQREGRSWPAADPCDARLLNKTQDASLMARMVARWQQRAEASGRFPSGLYLIATTSNFATKPEVIASAAAAKMDALIDYPPLSHADHAAAVGGACVQAYGAAGIGRDNTPMPGCDCVLDAFAASPDNEELASAAARARMRMFYGAFPSWSNNPRYPDGNATWAGLNSGARGMSDSKSETAKRDPNTLIQTHGLAFCSGPSPAAFGRLISAQLMRSLAAVGGCPPTAHDGAKVAAAAETARHPSMRQLVVVNAWNEWGEQAVLEPTSEDGDAMLQAHQQAIEAIEAKL